MLIVQLDKCPETVSRTRLRKSQDAFAEGDGSCKARLIIDYCSVLR